VVLQVKESGAFGNLLFCFAVFLCEMLVSWYLLQTFKSSHGRWRRGSGREVEPREQAAEARKQTIDEKTKQKANQISLAHGELTAS
jgi:hypothetical protein